VDNTVDKWYFCGQLYFLHTITMWKTKSLWVLIEHYQSNT